MRIVAILVGVALLTAGSASARTADPVTQGHVQRVLGLSGAPNFRDLGGYRTTDGRHVRWGKVYRSNKLSALTQADVARIQALNIGSMIDLRAADERQAEPDRWRPAFVYLSPKPSVHPLMAEILAHPESGASVKEGMETAYADMPRDFAPEFAEMLHRLAITHAALVMHCTAGKDRTGVASAILLSLLGVPRDTVVRDYELTEHVLPPVKAAVSPVAANPSALSEEAMTAVMAADPAYIDAALDSIDREYGSVDAYAETALGVSRAEIKEIRARLLAPVGR